MRKNFELLPSKNKMPGHGLFRNLFFFSFLVILPLCTLYFVCAILQTDLEERQQQEAFDEMAEITAHMQRLADPQTFFQDKLHRLSESFRWYCNPNEIPAPPYKNAIELFLFDEQGKRIAWRHGEHGKIRISEDYLKLLIKIQAEPFRPLRRREQAIAASFSGNAATIYSLSKSSKMLVDFQGLGLRKFGAWFRPRLSISQQTTGHLLVFIDPDKVSKFHLAQRAIQKIQKLAGETFGFAWIDLNNSKHYSCTGGVRLKEKGRQILSLTGLKSNFKYEENLFSVCDTPDGIRLICFRNLPKPPKVLEQYRNLLYIIIPPLILFLVWKSVFQIRLDLSVRLQFLLIFGYTAVTGLVILLAGIFALKSAKQASLIAERKHQAIRILEKIDRNFTASYGDLIRQYRHLNHLLSKPKANLQEILAPLQKAKQEDNIAFASYVNQHGEFLFRAPKSLEQTNTSVLDVKYANLIKSASTQIIKTFNSSRQKGNLPNKDLIGAAAISSQPIQGLLNRRSTLQYITFDGDETITFMDLTIKASDTADGCLFIVHEPQKLQLKYLSSSGKTIAASTGFQLVAFPKKSVAKSNYFPRYSLINEQPLWKLQDLVNQTQASSFKTGKIDGREVLVAAIPGYNLHNYNLFLIMPMNAIQKDARHLTKIFLVAAFLAIVFIAFLSGILIKSLIMPISCLAASASALSSKTVTIPTNICKTVSNELDTIATGLSELILKVHEFYKGHSIQRYLLPHKALELDQIVCDGFLLSMSNFEREIYHYAQISENLTLIFLMRTNLDGINGLINLSMVKMAVQVISEELSVHSPYQILKDLEEYFRINLRRKLSGDFFLGLFKQEESKIFWSGCGQIGAYILAQRQITKLELPQAHLGSTVFHNFGSRNSDFGEGMLAFIVSPTLEKVCGEKISKLLSNLNDLEDSDITSLKQKLQKDVEISCNTEAIDSASVLLILGRKLKSKDKANDSAKH